MKLKRYLSAAAAFGLIVSVAPAALAAPAGASVTADLHNSAFGLVQPAAEPTSFPTTPPPAPAPTDAVDVKDYDQLLAAIANGGYIRLTASFTLTETVEIPAGTTVTLDLNNKTLTAAKDGWRLKWGFINRGNLTVRTSTLGQQAAISSKGIQNYGQLALEGGTIECRNHDDGASVFNMVEEARFTMTGGSLYSFAGMTYGGKESHRDNSLYGTPLTQTAGQAEITGGMVVGDNLAMDIRGGTVSVSNAYVRGSGLDEPAVRVG